MGIFSKWQPVYEEMGVATFPVDTEAKKPAVGNYLRAGLPASREWASKFPEADALGFACGRKSGLTVLDIDAPDEKLLVEAFDIFGPSPVVIRTASGKFHAWYKHGGEGRSIRSAMPGKPVDVLGNGFALAPPSQKGQTAYQFIAGSLTDIALLPRMKKLVVPVGESTPAGFAAPANDVELVPVGKRNDELWRACMMQARSCETIDSLMNYAVSLNGSGLADPLADDEVHRIVTSAWAKESAGENWFGSGSRVVFASTEVSGLMMQNLDAFALLALLRDTHVGLRETFVVANAMAESMPEGGWPRKRFSAARKFLEDGGYIQMIRKPGGEGKAGLYRFG